MATLELGVKPLPLTVTWSPTKPDVGVMVIPDIVKVALAKLPEASWAFTVWLPSVTAGTVKVAVKLPVALVVTNAGLVVTVTSSNLMVTFELGVKPLPLTLTVAPTRPEVGVMVIFCTVVKVAVAFLAAASWAFTVWTPLVLAGTLKVAVKLPLVLVVTDAGLVVTVTASKVIVTL